MRKLYWILWGIIGVAMELFALFNGVPNDTLTGTITSAVPGWMVYAGLGWLGWHFMVSYLNGKDER